MVGICWILMGLIAAFGIYYCALQYYTMRFYKKYMKKFAIDPITQQYERAKSRVFFPEKSYDSAVLLLHGFSTSASDFEFLFPELEKNKIPYLAPTWNGYGLTHFGMLKKIHFIDWLRQGVEAYDVLSAQAKTIHIVANSYGCVLGSAIAMLRPVDTFIAVAPAYRISDPIARLSTKLINIPFVKSLLKFMFPYYEKQKTDRPDLMDIIDPEMAVKAFHMPVLPANVIATFWQADQFIDLKKMQIKHYYLFSAEDDRVIDSNYAKALLTQSKMPFEEFHYTNSAHCMLVDCARYEIIQKIIEILLKKSD